LSAALSLTTPPSAPGSRSCALDVQWQIGRVPTGELTPSERHLLNYVAIRGGGFGRSIITLARAADFLGCDVSTVKRTLRALRARPDALLGEQARFKEIDGRRQQFGSWRWINQEALDRLGRRQTSQEGLELTDESALEDEIEDEGNPAELGRGAMRQPTGTMPQARGVARHSKTRSSLSEDTSDQSERETRASAPPPVLVEDPPATESQCAPEPMMSAPIEPDSPSALEAPEPSPAVDSFEPVQPLASSPSTHDRAERFLDAFRRQWAAAHPGLTPRPHRDDASHARTLVDAATHAVALHLTHVPAAERDAERATTELLAHWTALYLAKPGSVSAKHPAGFLRSVGHGLRWFVDELSSLASQLPPAWITAAQQYERALQATREEEARAAREAAEAKRREERYARAARFAPREVAAAEPASAAPTALAPRGDRPSLPPLRSVDERAAYERVLAFLPAVLRAEGLALLAIPRVERTDAQRQRFARLQVLALHEEAHREAQARAEAERAEGNERHETAHG
jgi:hypothetical protein